MWPQLVLTGITMIWGVTFLAVHQALQWIGPYTLVGARFLIAALILAVVLRGKLRGITGAEWRAGLLIGLGLFFGYSLQTVGLQTIDSSKSAFLTALYVPLVPLLTWVLLRKAPSLAAGAGIVMAFAGMVLLTNPGTLVFTLSAGEFYTVLGAVAIAAEILMIGHFSQQCDPRRVAFIQLLTVGVVALATALVLGERQPEFTPGLIASVLGLAAASALIQFCMNWAQRYVNATRATLIYAMEPVWAAAVGALAGERLGLWGLTGGAMIVAAVLISTLERRKPNTNQ
ncbi:DMT family transporter [Pseudomonadota bacterium AL_CKDN230030165-1A_HGKHYDSX7]